MPRQTLFDATYRVARELGGVTEGVATGGSTTSIADTRILALTAANHFDNGTAWILLDAAEGVAAPEGEFGEISSDDGAGTLTVRAATAGSGDPFTAAVASGDRYAVTTSKYPPHQIISAVNSALLDMGTIPVTDKVSLDTATSQTEYILPAGSPSYHPANMDLREVWIQGRTGDANDNRWFKIQSWSIERTATGSGDLLVLPFQYVTGRDIKVVYMEEHPELDDATDEISESVHMNRIVFEAALKLLEWRDAQPGNDPNIERHMRRLKEPGADGLSKIERMRAQHAIYAPPRQSKLLTLGRRAPVDNFTTPGP